ncbi:hypothetical protein GCM10009103_00420 [Pseudomonas koreensis]|nr:hypothetical protein GCM10009103_00420 [Pseudomonas koreensis]
MERAVAGALSHLYYAAGSEMKRSSANATPVARELAPAWVRSAQKIIGAAAPPSGSKLPRHNGSLAPSREA